MDVTQFLKTNTFSILLILRVIVVDVYALHAKEAIFPHGRSESISLSVSVLRLFNQHLLGWSHDAVNSDCLVARVHVELSTVTHE